MIMPASFPVGLRRYQETCVVGVDFMAYLAGCEEVHERSGHQIRFMFILYWNCPHHHWKNLFYGLRGSATSLKQLFLKIASGQSEKIKLFSYLLRNQWLPSTIVKVLNDCWVRGAIFRNWIEIEDYAVSWYIDGNPKEAACQLCGGKNKGTA